MKQMSKKVFYSLTAIALCAVITCVTVLCFVFLGNGTPTVQAGSLVSQMQGGGVVTADFTGTNGSTNLSPFSRVVWGVGPTISTDHYAPGNGPSSMRFTYPAGFQDGETPGKAWATIDTTEVFAEFWFMFSDNFAWNGSSDKLIYIPIDGAPWQGGADAMLIYSSAPNGGLRWWTQYNPGAGPWFSYTDMYSRPAYKPQKGEWVKIKLHAKLSTPGNSDGLIRLWVNDNLNLENDKVNYHTKAGSKFTSFEFAPVYGGGGVPQKSHEDYLYFDAFKIATVDWDPPLGPPNIASHGFDNGTFGPFGTHNPPGPASITNEDHAPGSGPNSLRFDYSPGTLSGYEPTNVWLQNGIPSASEIYTQYWFKYSDNWYWHFAANKQAYWYIGEGVNFWIGVAEQQMILEPQNYDGVGNSARWYPNLATKRIEPGVWYKFKMRTVLNTASNQDGIIEMWIDDVKIMHRTNIRYATGIKAGSKLNQFAFYPIWGGGGNTKPSNQHFYVDDFKISTVDFNNENQKSPTSPGNIVR